jgi:outer membrane lipoprotein-sorting protein
MPAARDPNKLEPAYLITLAVIVGLPICCSYLSREPAAPKMAVPDRAFWTVTMGDTQTGSANSSVALQDGKWRLEMRNPENGDRLVVVNDGRGFASNQPDFQSAQLSAVDPVKQLHAVAATYNRHPKPDSVSLDGVLCWHTKTREGNDEVETWLDAKTGFPKKFTATRGGRTITSDFSKFSATVPDDPRLFDRKVLEPVLEP